ncbi:MAG TPA: hypothetical protein VIS29_21780 [Streptomyces sp.]
MLVTRQIPALFNGVSQQPPPVRSPSQLEALLNCTSSVVDGVRKRSPLEHVAKLSSTHLGTALLHTINRDLVERYEVVVTETGIRVFDMAGVEKTVTAPLGWDYLALPAGAEARFSYICMTVADYTFVLNKTKLVEMLPVGADLAPPSDEYWWLNRPLNSSPSPAIAGLIEDDDSGGVGAGGGTASSSVPPPPTTIPSAPAGTLKGTVQTLQDLPTTGVVDGDVYKIVGTDQSNFQSYYVIRSGTSWNETVLPGLANLVDAETMPHALIRQGDGTFVFGPFAWSPRRVGDENTNPNPTFVGRPIRDIFFWKNRLGFTADENVVGSRVGDFGNFYRLTVVDYLPDDVIDVAASETKVTKMEFAVPFQGKMVLFSDQTQLALEFNQVLSGSTVSLDVLTEYPTVSGVRPARSGSDVYFASQGSGWGQVREYYVTDSDDHDASNITAHVPKYIPKRIHSLIAAPEFDALVVATDETPDSLYPYFYYWQSDTEKAQSAWSTWTFRPGDTILAGSILGGYLYLVVDREDGTYLDRLAMFYGSTIAGLDFQVYLDRRAAATGVYDATANATSFTLPYAVPPEDRALFRLVFGNDFAEARGASRAGTQITWVSDTEIMVQGDRSAGPCAVGFVFESRLVFSRQYPQNGRGETIHTGRLQLKTFSVYHTDTAYFRAEVRPYGAGTEPLYTSEFPMRKISVDGLGVVGSPVFMDDKATFGVQANAGEAEIALVNDTHLGFCINSAEWEGFYYNRARA